MEYYNGILCISGKELIVSEYNLNGIMPEGTFKSLSYRKKINILREEEVRW